MSIIWGVGPPQVVVGRYADVHCVFSDTDTFKSEMPRGPGWEQFNKIMFAQFVTQMDGEQHAPFAAAVSGIHAADPPSRPK